MTGQPVDFNHVALIWVRLGRNLDWNRQVIRRAADILKFEQLGGETCQVGSLD